MTVSETDKELPLDIIDHDQSAPPRREQKWKLWRVPAVLILLMTGGILGMYFQPPGLQRVFAMTGLTPGGGADTPFAVPVDIELPDDVIATMQPSDVVGLARLLPEGDVVTVAPPYGAGDARVAEVLVEIGDQVERMQRVAVLDNLRQLESAVSVAESNVAVAEATLAQTRQSVSLSTAEAEAELERTRAAAEEARAELSRTRSLSNRGVATQSALDQAVSAAAQADRAVERAAATLARYTSEEPDAQPDVIVALRSLGAAMIELEKARRDLAKAYVISPVTGTVLDIHVRPGEALAADGVMDIGNIDQMMAEVEVFQTQISMVEAGQPVELHAEALDRMLYGRVHRIGLIVRRQTVVSDDTAANTDARVVEVLVALDDDSSIAASRFTNLEIVARIDTRSAE